MSGFLFYINYTLIKLIENYNEEYLGFPPSSFKSCLKGRLGKLVLLAAVDKNFISYTGHEHKLQCYFTKPELGSILCARN